MQITSTNFQDNEPIPTQFSADGDNINPALTFSEIPEGTESVVLILEDPDAPGGTFTHWIVYNMSPATLQITEGEIPISGIEGLNDTGQKGYFGPKPPAGETHRYLFRLLALDTALEFDKTTQVNRNLFDEALDRHVIEETEIVGCFTGQ